MTSSFTTLKFKMFCYPIAKKKDIEKKVLELKIVNVSKGKMFVSYFHIFLNRRKQLYDDGWCLLDTVFISSYRLLHRNVQVSYCNIYLVV